MKISLLHGDNQKALRVKLDQISGKFKEEEITRAYGKEITANFLANQVRGGDLFSERKLLILANPDKDLEISKWMDNESIEILIYFDANLSESAKILAEARSVRAEVFNFSEIVDRRIFKLLDLVLLGDRGALVMLENLVDELGEQYILAMLYYNWRRIVLKKLPVGRLADVGKKKGREGVAELYRRSLEVDFKIKSGLISGRDGLFWLLASMV